MPLYINEFLPNPAGADAEGEWIELFNASETPISLAGWSLAAGDGKPKALPAGTVSPGGYIVMYRSEMAISLKNTNGEILLFGPGGNILDQLSFRGVAPENKSINRGSGSMGYFALPSPGTQNNLRASRTLLADDYPRGVPISGASDTTIVPLWISSSLLIAAATFLMVKWSHDLSQLFFPRD